NGNGNGHAHLEIGPLPRLKKSRALVTAVILIASLITIITLRANDPAPTIAVGSIQGDPALRDMLATSLARIEGARVISNTRILELTHGDTNAATIARAARRAGAERLLEGRVFRDDKGELRLDLQWVRLSDGRAEQAARVSEGNTFGLVDAATSAIASDLDVDAPTLQFASVTTQSVQAYRLFEEGLRAYYREERTGAESLWRRAVAADSTFAIALWYLSRLHDREHEYTARALRHSEHTSDRERLFIRASFLSQMDDPLTVAVAETLAIRYPAEPDGHFLLGYATMWAGDPLRAIPHFRAVVHMDSTSLFDENALRCRACDALGEIGTALAMADSGAALLRFAKEWVRVQPNSRGAWSQLVIGYEITGQYAKALEARRKTVSIPPANYADINIAETYMRAGDFKSADEFLLDRIRHADRELSADAWFKYSLSLRSQGKYREAVHAAREFRRLTDDPTPIYSANPEAWARLIAGEPKRAMAIFDSIAYTRFTPLSAARNARAFVGGLARVAEAAFASGDTIRLKQVIDTMQTFGRYTAFAPARESHHFARGLLYEKRGDHLNAVNEFRAAMPFPVGASTRINLHLARELMVLGRSREAAQVLGRALRTTVGGSGYAVTHRELHELAANAWRAAGNADSARTHSTWLREVKLLGSKF
ncbi:MAG TPA: hypothetical protein VM100_06550, partial [Longimicrobiales bacterium]|nr:hypothetical protein [Longimicrobiales bacterium]